MRVWQPERPSKLKYLIRHSYVQITPQRTFHVGCLRMFETETSVLNSEVLKCVNSKILRSPDPSSVNTLI